ncbi:hypothetical protein C2869_06245 [Saccharobesus litoralis]|uniref:TIGR00659 family protein n=1 Tax=Saccharobesus litoralis TaxID=2172099 RepID=A0A2S0VPE6_9ALTE|nr:LrgB family protein [Saccharobesus litoralis]AWB66063.1 hypothetical protein C2869_06245 [Saccharobesus litoralis]
MTEQQNVWVYLSSNPLLHLTMTMAVFALANKIYKKANFNPLLNPVLISIMVIVSFLLLSNTSYDTYFTGAQFIHFLLGPATVALAIPLYKQFNRIKQSAGAIVASLLIGSSTAAVSAIGIAWLLDAKLLSIVSLAPKSITAPVAMGISEQLGGLASLTAVLVILTGILGAMLGPWIVKLIKIKDNAALGMALGTASHGIGTARALQVNDVAGAFSGLAMGLNALATAILLPLLWQLF